MTSHACFMCKYYPNCADYSQDYPYHLDCPREEAVKAERKRLDDIKYKKLKGFKKFLFWFIKE
jgi:hypothetical protein